MGLLALYGHEEINKKSPLNHLSDFEIISQECPLAEQTFFIQSAVSTVIGRH